MPAMHLVHDGFSRVSYDGKQRLQAAQSAAAASTTTINDDILNI
jgi:hypothetical protein